MKRLVVLALALVALVFLLGAQDQAQKPVPAEPADDTSRIVLEVNRVNLLFTVTDKKGRFITDLTKDDFEVFENKKQQNIIQFTAESDLPLRLAILIDTSNSIRERFHFQQQAAAEFVRLALRPEQDKAMVVSFDSSTELVSDLTGDMHQLEKAIDDLRPGGGTSLYDAVFFACRDKLMQDQPMHKFRRAMVILSDGNDTASRYSRDQALEMAQKGDVVMYTISTNDSHLPMEGDKIMKYYAGETGGVAFFPFKAEDLTQSFINVANELRHQYNLYYRPEPLVADGKYHPVSVRVRGRKDLIVHARKGYYAPSL